MCFTACPRFTLSILKNQSSSQHSTEGNNVASRDDIKFGAGLYQFAGIGTKQISYPTTEMSA